MSVDCAIDSFLLTFNLFSSTASSPWGKRTIGANKFKFQYTGMQHMCQNRSAPIQNCVRIFRLFLFLHSSFIFFVFPDLNHCCHIFYTGVETHLLALSPTSCTSHNRITYTFSINSYVTQWSRSGSKIIHDRLSGFILDLTSQKFSTCKCNSKQGDATMVLYPG